MVSETIIHFPGYNLFFHEFHEMAVAYENEDTSCSVLSTPNTSTSATWIGKKHRERTSSTGSFNLTATLGLQTRKTWEERDDFVIIESVSRRVTASILCTYLRWGTILVPIRGHMRVERFVATTRIIQKSLTSSELSPRIPFRGGITTFWNSESLGSQHIKPYRVL